LTWKLLHNDPLGLALMDYNPFPDEPPQYIRIQRYGYEFGKPGAGEEIWKRELIGTWLPPLSKNSPDLRAYILANRWDEMNQAD